MEKKSLQLDNQANYTANWGQLLQRHFTFAYLCKGYYDFLSKCVMYSVWHT